MSHKHTQGNDPCVLDSKREKPDNNYIVKIDCGDLQWHLHYSERTIRATEEYLSTELEDTLFDSAVGWVRDAPEDVRDHLADLERVGPDLLREDDLIESIVINLRDLPVMKSAMNLLPTVAEDIDKIIIEWWVRVAVHEAAYQRFKASHPEGIGEPYQLVTVGDDE